VRRLAAAFRAGHFEPEGGGKPPHSKAASPLVLLGF
jgi:hypothetical protein